MKKANRLVSLLLAFLLLLGSMSALAAADTTGGALSNFAAGSTYADGQFKDVKADSWFVDGVKNAFELGLVKGTKADVFDPFGDITIAQTLALACRLHSIYYSGKADFVQGTPWYQVYVDYAVDNGIIKKGEYANVDAAATRSQFAAILSKSLDAAALPAINTVDDNMIPDVSTKSANADAIYQLYRAGILVGNDKAGTFTPDTKIQRAAVATIVTRMALPDTRQKITLSDKQVTSVTLDLNAISFVVGESYTLKVTVAPADAKDASVTWATSDSSVATVSNGTVKAVGAGNATITCTAKSGVSAKCAVSVYPAVSSVSMPATVSVEIGKTATLSAAVNPDNALYKKLTWSSSNTSVATVDASGVVTGKKAGTAIITAKASNGKSASCTVTVTKPEKKVTSVTLNLDALSFVVGESYALKATVSPADATDASLTWTTSDSSVATVSNGTVKAVGAGNATITCTAKSGVSAKCVVSVYPAVSSVSMPATASVGVGKSTTLKATVNPNNAMYKTLTWSSSDTSVATVDAKGVVTGKKLGTCVITAKASNGKSASCTVTVAEIGTRSNPLPALDGSAIEYNEYSFKPTRTISVKCVSVLTGDAATELALYMNQFNKVPSASQEWRFYKFEVHYISSTDGEDDVMAATDIIYDDTFFKPDGASVKGSSAYLGKEYKGMGIYDVNIYPGGTATVVVGYLTEKVNGDVLLKIPYAAGKKNTWIRCDAYNDDLVIKNTPGQNTSGVNITLKDKLPSSFNEYDSKDRIESTVKITEFSYTVSGSQVKLLFTGEKTYDYRGKGQSDSCKIGWKLYDAEGYIVDSGTCFTDNIAMGEKFRNAYSYADINGKGNYTLDLLNVN